MKQAIVFFLCALISACVWDSSLENPDYLPLDDSEYPYADLPRVVIETERFQEIRNTESKIPAKLQVYHKDGPESNVMDITISGRGYSSFKMPKYSYKIKSKNNTTLLDFPKGKSWNLVANYIDKSMLRNYISLKLAEQLQMSYTPRAAFVELYLNRAYMGVFLLTEHIDVSKHRVNLPQNASSFLLEMEPETNDGSIYVSTKMGTQFKVLYPEIKDNPYIDSLLHSLNQWENYLHYSPDKSAMDNYFKFDEYIKFYWAEEFSKNNDAAYSRSTFFTWKKDGPIQMGPVWDFDVAYGNKPQKKMQVPENWHIRTNGWHKFFFEDTSLKKRVSYFWASNRTVFENFVDSIDTYSTLLKKAHKNEYKRWNIKDASYYGNSDQIYESHQESVDSLKSWINKRFKWIDDNYDK